MNKQLQKQTNRSSNLIGSQDTKLTCTKKNPEDRKKLKTQATEFEHSRTNASCLGFCFYVPNPFLFLSVSVFPICFLFLFCFCFCFPNQSMLRMGKQFDRKTEIMFLHRIRTQMNQCFLFRFLFLCSQSVSLCFGFLNLFLLPVNASDGETVRPQDRDYVLHRIRTQMSQCFLFRFLFLCSQSVSICFFFPNLFLLLVSV